MAENKTKATMVDVETYVAGLEPERRREDAAALIELMGRVTGREPAMWGPSMIGFGRQEYRYESGHGGTMFGVGFAPRASENVLYVLDGTEEVAALLPKLGKYRTGKSCLYVKRIADLDGEVLEALVTASWQHAVAAGAN